MQCQIIMYKWKPCILKVYDETMLVRFSRITGKFSDRKFQFHLGTCATFNVKLPSEIFSSQKFLQILC